MNKKILILPLVVTTLGLTSCKKKDDTVTDTTSIATQMYEASVASAKSLNNFKISTNVSDSNMKLTYHQHLPDAKATKPWDEYYTSELTNVSLQSNLRVGGFQLIKYKKDEESGEEYPINQSFKANLQLQNLNTKGTLKYSNVRKPSTKEIKNDECTVSFNDTSKIDELNLFLNRKSEGKSNKDYNMYANFGSSDVQLSQLKYDFHDTPYEKAKNNIKERIENITQMIEEESKRYIGISNLTKIPYVGKFLEPIVQKICEGSLGIAGQTVIDYANGTDPKKEDCIEVIKKALDTIKENVGEVLTMTNTDNKPYFTFNLDCEHLNKFTQSDVFYNGSASITVSVDDSKRISNISCSINNLKTNNYLELPEFEIPGEEEKTIRIQPEIYFKDFSLKFDTAISYDFGYYAFSNEIDTNTTGFTEFPLIDPEK